ncbi:MAG: hypothetical protein U0457_19300 [Candidatus Sericytochromatia bacterium]
MKIRAKKGLFLTEVMITIVLIAIAMLSITPVLFIGAKSGKIIKKKSIEVNVAQKEIESFKQKDFFTVFNEIKVSNPAFGTSGNMIYAPPPPPLKYVNPDTAEIIDAPKVSFFPLNIIKTYQFLDDTSSQWGQAIQLNVTVQIQQPDSQPAKISAILGRDRVK